MGPVQVSPAHYDRADYNKKARWASYWHQVVEVVGTGAKSCLEIGTGSGIVKHALNRAGVATTSVDIDPELGPDAVGDVRSLPYPDQSFDVVLASQVLEHIPWPDVPRALGEIRRVCRSHAVLSLPQAGVGIGVLVNTSLSFVGEHGVSVRVGSLWRHRWDGQHYWEVGARGTSRKTVRALLQRDFLVEREYTVPEFTYHRFYILRPR